MSDIDEIRAALNFIDPHDRDMWIKMGAAVKDELGESGFDVWDNWSQQSDNYKPRDAKSAWKSLKAGHIRIGTLFYEAKQAGYKPSKPYTPPSTDELARRAKDAEQRRLAEEKATARAQQRAQRTAQNIWRHNKDNKASAQHPYLVKKGITNHYIFGQIRQNNYKGTNNLLIPVLHNKQIVSMQFIDEAGSKRFLNGGRMQGSYTFIGDTSRMNQGIIIAEGVATAASLYQATGLPVVVAFNAGNLKAVAEKMQQSMSADVPVIIAADNDVSQTGINKAKAAAEVFGQRATVIMPEFTPEQIQQHQQQSGQDLLPSDFNDLQQLAGLEAVRQAIGLTYQEEPEQTPENIEIEPEWQKPDRTPWGDFPPVIRNGNMGELKNEPEYRAAKGGDVLAAAHLISKLINDHTAEAIQHMIGEHKPYIVPVQAEEATGKNKIPLAMANAFSQKLGLPIDYDIWQANKVSRTGAGIDHRLAFQPKFNGKVEAGREYILMDDTLSVGSTIANLKGYIETHGGKVLGAAVMTAHEGSLNIVIKPTMIQAINRKHGDGMDKLWKEEFGYGIDKLTQGEAGHLRAAKNVDAIRTRISAARNETRPGMAATELPKIQSAQPAKEITPEATEPVASSLVEPPLQQSPTTTAEPAVFLRPEQTNMSTDMSTETEIINSIELNEQKPEWVHEPDPFFEQRDEPAFYADLSAESYYASPEPFNTQDKQVQTNAEAKPELKPEAEPAEAKPVTTSKKVVQQEDNPAHQTEPVTPTGNEPEAEQSETNQPEPDQTTEPEASENQERKPITDLHYDTPQHLIDRYIVADGKYLSAANGTTVLFEDKGKKLTTAKTDMQTVRDMLEVAKAKNWDSIKLSGTPEFKAMMYVAAESQGIRTSGYKPTAADLAIVEKLRGEQALNSIEAITPKLEQTQKQQPQPAQAKATSTKQDGQPAQNKNPSGERIVAHASASYKHNPKSQESYYITLENNGHQRTVWGIGLAEAIDKAHANIGDMIQLNNLGKKPVTIHVPVHDDNGRVIDYEEKNTHRNVFEIDVLTKAPMKEPSRPEPETHTAAQPAAESQPESTRTEASPSAPQQPTETEPVKASKEDMDFNAAKDLYLQKAEKLSKDEKAKLMFYEQNTMKAIDRMPAEIHHIALQNFYVNTVKAMHGSKFDAPHPIQIPTHETKRAEPAQRTESVTQVTIDETEIDR
ncbi:PriCT-2 domain-containing protein [Neisseriaceae bacterium ESL0693]|nr:PriCT-2 domain-containing protein [Neisseriaceae bacterium ESL0693]